MGMGWLHTLRGKLIVSTILVEAVIIGAVLWNGLRLTEAHLLEQFDLRRKETTLLLDAALAPAMAQRDYAAVSDILQATQAINSIDYLVMFDNDGQIIATANWDRRRPLPATDNPARLLDGNGLQNFDLRIPMSIGGRQLASCNTASTSASCARPGTNCSARPCSSPSAGSCSRPWCWPPSVSG